MKDFWKMFFASLLGSIFSYAIITILFFVLLVGVIAKLASFSTKTTDINIKDNSILVLNLDKEIVERSSDLFSSFSSLSTLNDNQIELYTLLKTIKYAAQDDRIKGMLVHVSSPNAGYGTLQSIRQAISSFKKKGKFVVAYGEGMTQKAYFIASVAHKILLAKGSNLELKGIYFQLMFFKRALEKLNIDVQVIRHGKFKSAVEPFILEKMSPENREQYELLATSLWKTLADSITKSRTLPYDTLNFVVNNLLAYKSTNAYRYKLVDSLLYYSDLTSYVNDHFKTEMNFIQFQDYLTSEKEKMIKSSSNKIALVFAYGDIVDGSKYEPGSIQGEYYAELIKKLANKDDIKAIVLRVNSPGGDALASEQIWHSVVEATQKKPVVVSMGDYAASGGYFISCAANYIVAEPTTITGSIGVFGLIPNAQHLLNQKLGITIDEVKTHEHSDFISIFKSLSPYDTKILQQEIEKIYTSFTTAVAKGRKLDVAKVDSIGQGRVWLGLDALKIHLVDTFGNLQTAIQKAAQLAKIDNYSVVEYPKKTSSIEKLVEKLTTESSYFALDPTLVNYIKNYISVNKPVWLTRMPFEIIMN